MYQPGMFVEEHLKHIINAGWLIDAAEEAEARGNPAGRPTLPSLPRARDIHPVTALLVAAVIIAVWMAWVVLA